LIGQSSAVSIACLAGFALVGLLWWRQAVWGVLLLAIFDGAVRKWLLPGAQEWVYFWKDALLIGAYLRFFGERLGRGESLFGPHAANLVLGILGILGVVQAANPAVPNPIVGMFGLRAYFLYVPLMYMVPSLLPDAPHLRRVSLFVLGIALIPLLLGVVQFASSPTDSLNRYAWADEMGGDVAGFAGSGHARITGTFSYITGYTTFLTLIMLIALSETLVASARWRVVLVVEMVLIVGNILMTGSRGPALIVLVGVVGLVVVSVWKSRVRRGRIAVGATMVVIAACTVAQALFPEAQKAFLDRTISNGDVPGRIADTVIAPVRALAQVGLTGYGLGTTHQATSLIGGGIGANPPPLAEVELERVVLETGLPGLVLLLAARILVSVQLWRALRKPEGTQLRPYLAVGFLFTLLLLPGNLVFNNTAALFYWFLAGLALMGPSTSVTSPAAASRARGALEWTLVGRGTTRVSSP